MFYIRIDLNLNMNATNYRYNHAYRYAAKIILHFIPVNTEICLQKEMEIN